MMLNNRRKFLVTTGFAAGGAALSGLRFIAIASESRVAAAEREVSEVISQYGSSVKVTRNGGQATEHRVKMRGHEQFAKTFDAQRGLPFERIYVAEGNTLRFKHRGVTFTLVNVI